MKKRISTFVAVVGVLVAVSATDLLAAGRGNGGGNGKRNGTCVSQQTARGGGSAVRPAGSQRRDGTFLTTGVTANGSAVRQGKGKGVMDGSRLNTTAATDPATAQ
jgi:hypothetical protein